METALVGGCVGCVGGCFSAAALQALFRGGKSSGAADKNDTQHKRSPIKSPSRFASPPSHLRRDTPGLGRGTTTSRVDSTASVSTKKADFGILGGVPSDLDCEGFIRVLGNLISESRYLQNNPRLGVVPEEKRGAAHVLAELKPFSTEAGGPLIIEELEYVPGRSNLKIVYPGTTNKTIAFVGSHLDVVPADAEVWKRDPFSLTVEGEKLYGRGTTDCLGHVALLTCILKQLGQVRPSLKRSIVVLFIAGEEGGESGVGVDKVVEAGKLEETKLGPLYWVDCADSQPCCGTSGMLSWSLKCSGRLFHSGFPHKAINSIELASEATAYVQERFYEDFPPNTAEEQYQFATGSHMKPTQIDCSKGSLNQINPCTTVHGDIRLSPFYEVEDVMQAVEHYVSELNEDLQSMSGRGPWSKFVLADTVDIADNESRRGKVELKWAEGLDVFQLYAGVAVNLESDGHKALVQAIRETTASVKPFSVSGSLPLVKSMQRSGFDIQLCGFGLMSVYHGVDEYCELGDMVKAYQVLLRIICLLEMTET